MSIAQNPLQEKSPKGHDGYTLLSAMQKFIRRSMEEEALYCFYELEAMKCYNIAQNRLLITIYEDIGLENSNLVNSIPMHIEKMNDFYSKKNGAWRLVLGYIILSACRGQKSRVTDQFVCTVAAKMVGGYVIDFDKHDFVFDMHTLKGKMLKRGADHFYHEASKIINDAKTTDYFDEEIKYSDIVEKEGFNVLNDYRLTTAELFNRRNTLFNQ